MKIRSLLILILHLLALGTSAQLTERPVARYEANGRQSARTEAILSLPFWDDFSSGTGTPDPNLWINSEDVWVNPGMGVVPPTINVATFDGLDRNGKPYSLDLTTDGPTDVLTGDTIDLSGFGPTDAVYLAFFLELKGKGEVPNANDSMRVEFLDVDKTWKWAWSIRGDQMEADTFELVTIQVTSPEFFHNEFQFRFRSFGRQSGGFDTWNLDYVYMNSGVTNFDFPDRAMQAPPTSIFKDYYSIPIHHFNQDPALALAYPKATGFNLHNLLQPANFSMALEISSLQPDLSTIVTNDLLANEVISSFPDPIGTGIRQIDLMADNLLDPSNVQSDTFASIDIKVFMNTDDNEPPDYLAEFAPLDFRVNDTIYTQQVLHDYYAYDDGTAEFSTGVNRGGDMVAYLFPMYYTGKDTLVSVDMYFPNKEGNIAGKNLRVMVWANDNGTPGTVLYSQTFSLKAPSTINEFINYKFQQPVIVENSFFIGWYQSAAGSMDIGLDKNNDTGDRIFYNLFGTWEQNLAVKGSLMLRPHFGKVDLVTSIREIEDEVISIYPNPNAGVFSVMGAEIEAVYDMLGKPVDFYLTDNGNEVRVHMGNALDGFYIMKLKQGNSIITRRVLVRR